MKWTERWQRMIIGCTAIATLAAVAPIAEAGSSSRRATRALRMEASREAAAALTAVGAASGWGRIKVEDSTRTGAAKREVEVNLFDMEPSTRFSIEADGVMLGWVTTDGAGWAMLKLETDDNSHSPVPANLPAVADLQSASVRDASDAFILEGSFVRFAVEGEDASAHEEKISLADQQGIGAAGVAKVEREASGKQEFDSRATGLFPGSSYIVMVDGFMAGKVTADPIGQARLKLESPDDENPLPVELQPVEGLRVVEWLDLGDAVVLAGVFTGISNDDDNGDDDGDNGDDDGGNSGPGIHGGGTLG